MFLRHFADRTAGVPYGIALGIGGLLTYPRSAAGGLGARSGWPRLTSPVDPDTQALPCRPLVLAPVGGICINFKLITIVSIALTVI